MQDTLEFENGRHLQSLFANDHRLLKTLQERLGVKATARDGWLRLDGEAGQVAKARQIFEQLDAASRKGMSIGRPEFEHALLVAEGQSDRALQEFNDGRIQTSSKKSPVIPKTAGQMAYLEAMSQFEIVFGIGPAGTGKTYLAVAKGIDLLKRGEVHRLVLTRPAVEAGEALGFLPGDLQEKIYPYLRPLYDALQDMLDADEVQRWMDRGVVEVAPLAYMRGRTLSRAFVILDEAQNTTCEQMFMFLTRLGSDSRCVITGDPTQLDLPSNRKSGLIEALSALRGVEGIGFHHFQESDVVRHPLVRAIIKAYRSHRDGVPTGGSKSLLA